MAVTNIGVVNYSSTPDTEVAEWAAAAQKQMHDDVAPAWGIPAPQLNLVPADTHPAGVDSWIVVVNDAHQRVGLGYHQLYRGQPVGYVLVEYTKSDGQTPSRVFSHEVLEMAIDADMSKETSPIDGVVYMVEAGDILSFDEGGYLIDDVLVSGFGTPAYFHLQGGTVYAIRHNLTGPLPAAAPANMGTMLCWQENGLLRTRFPALAAPPPQFMRRPHGGSRRFRRTLPREEWRDRETRSPVTTRDRGAGEAPEVMAIGTDKLPSGTWNLGPVNIQWSLKAINEIAVDLSIFGIDVDTLSGTLGPHSTKLQDTINVLGIVTGPLALTATYGAADDRNGLYLEGRLSGPGFDTGPLNSRIVPW
jgi:hypothetical protein